MVRRCFLWFTVGLVAACAPQGDANKSDADAGPREGYPSGPYGVTEDSIIAPLEFIDIDGTSFSLEDIYTNSSNHLLLITTAAGWCASCIKEQQKLQELHNNYASDGLYVMVSVFEDVAFEPADAELAAEWKSQHKLSFTVVADPDFVLGDYYEPTLTPMTMLVHVASMEIIKLATGWDPGMVQAVIEARL